MTSECERGINPRNCTTWRSEPGDSARRVRTRASASRTACASRRTGDLTATMRPPLLVVVVAGEVGGVRREEEGSEAGCDEAL